MLKVVLHSLVTGLLFSFLPIAPGPWRVEASLPHGKGGDRTTESVDPVSAKSHRGMAWIPGGVFWMGIDRRDMPEAGPVHKVEINGFWMDKTDVTNAQFAHFVAATGYVTVAERPIDPKQLPGYRGDLSAGSIVFSPPKHPVNITNPMRWWKFVRGADWRHPEGPDSNIIGKDSYPVVQVAWEDAVAYARWAHKGLPTEAEWEFAARGGLDRKEFVWGNNKLPDRKWPANLFQGSFPERNSGLDGYRGLAPVASFPPNGYGLYDMSGNAWQWCADWYRAGYYRTLLKSHRVAVNPQGPSSSLDPDEPSVAKRVLKGGSFLCTDQYCSRYRPGARGKEDPLSGTNHIGFRCIASGSTI